jgi:hypothetical protein
MRDVELMGPDGGAASADAEPMDVRVRMTVDELAARRLLVWMRRAMGQTQAPESVKALERALTAALPNRGTQDAGWNPLERG